MMNKMKKQIEKSLIAIRLQVLQLEQELLEKLQKEFKECKVTK